MCGILLVCSRAKDSPTTDHLQDLLKSRGPDSYRIIEKSIPEVKSQHQKEETRPLHISLVSTVLSLRGRSLVAQPLVDKTSGSLFCWNGEAWMFQNQRIEGNDSAAIFEAIINRLNLHNQHGQSLKSSHRDSAAVIKDVLEAVQGPFAFLFYEARSRRVFYGRDRLGRRSLLLRYGCGHLTISSVGDNKTQGTWHEISTGGIYELDLRILAEQYQVSEERSKIESVEIAVPGCLFYPWTVNSVINRAKFCSINQKTKHNFADSVAALHQQLHQSLSLRITNIHATGQPNTPNLAVLFSGGLDCTILARICHDILPLNASIDLLNVAFENPRVMAVTNKNGVVPLSLQDTAFSSCPDRITGLSSYQELKEVCPGRDWSFISIDVPYDEMLLHRTTVLSLMYPHNTEMDLSISLALYFASRGKGRSACSERPNDYTSDARVLLSGLGADELFGGYTRHERAYLAGGEDALLDELELDFTRIGTRNLGRDDRIISHWGKEARYPFLDESLTSWALRRPSWEKLDMDRSETTQGQVSGNTLQNRNKLIVRLLAAKLGLSRAADERKRAIQFGARTAKMLHGKAKGTQAISSPEN